MASSSGTSQEQRRWLTVGIGLHIVLIPRLKEKIKNEMTPFYLHMVQSFGLDKQTSASYKKSIPPSKFTLNYGSINNNATLYRHPRHYDYCVKDEVSLARLFMKPFMAQFNAFDYSFDSSAALAVLCGAPPFAPVQRLAEDVRSKVRNEWAHCNFTAWTQAHFDTCFDLMEALVTNLQFPLADEAKILDELKLWRTQGPEICLGKPLDDTVLQFLRNQVQQMSDSLDENKGNESNDQKRIWSTLALFKSEVDSDIHVLQQQQSSLQATCEELKNNQELQWKKLQKVESTLQRCLKVSGSNTGTLTLSDDSEPVLFDAPEKNVWFIGREKEVEILEMCLPFESISGVKMVAICGLGGCGLKTTLAAHFVWKHKSEYKGGVFWISMEDDRKFKASITDMALRLGMMETSFDLTLSKVLTWISKRKETWLLVLEDVNQQNLSKRMRKVFTGQWKRQARGHALLITINDPKEVCEFMDLEPSSCFDFVSFSEGKVKKFLVVQKGIDEGTGEEVALYQLMHKFGSLPLAFG